MHKIADKKFTIDDFSHEHLFNEKNSVTILNGLDLLENIIGELNRARTSYLETKEKDYWWQIIQLLPSSYNQRRTIMLNYEVLNAIYYYRKYHKQDEWRDFCAWIETLPYSELITCNGCEEVNKK